MSQVTTTLARPRAHTVRTHPTLREHRRAVASWALAHGHRLDRDALAVLVALRTGPDGTIDHRWTVELVERATADAAVSWCDGHGVAVPFDLATTLLTYLRYLSATRSLARGSDPVTALRRAVSAISPTVRSRSRHPARGGQELAPVLPIN